MNKDKNALVITHEPSNFVISALMVQLEKTHTVLTCELPLTVTTLANALTGRDIDICIIFTKNNLIDFGLISYLKDVLMNDKPFPVFIMGDEDKIKTTKSYMPKELVTSEYVYPGAFTVLDIANDITLKTRKYFDPDRRTIMVIDDSPIQLKYAKDLLEPKYKVILAPSGISAIKTMALKKPDLILLDYDMPITNGKIVLEMIRSESDFTAIPVMFLTGVEDTERIIEIMSLSPANYILKSNGPQYMLDIINNFFQKDCVNHAANS